MPSRLLRASALFIAACTLAVAPGHAEASATPFESIIPGTKGGDLSNTPAVRTITIDGREITVTLVVRTWPIGADPNHPTRRQVTTHVSLDTVDGNVLPQELSATRVRLARVAPPQRTYTRELTSLPTIASLIGHAEFGNDEALYLAPNARFRATVRIEHEDGVITVPMGVTSVIQTRLTLLPTE